MKKIAITGNIGKTTMAELLYQYLAQKGYSVLLFCTNGVFDSSTGLINKSIFNYMLNSVYQFRIEEDTHGYDYCIVEMIEESAYMENLKINQEHFDLVLNASYDPIITSFHQNEHPDFGLKFLNELSTDQLLINAEEEAIYNLQRPYQTYSATAMEILPDSNLNQTYFTYNNNTYTTSLINKNILKDLMGVTKAIELLNEFDESVYREFLADSFVRGRFEKHFINNKNIIIDNGWNGISNIISNLQEENIFMPLSNTYIIFIPHHHLLPTSQQALEQRNLKGIFLKANNVELTISNSADEQNTLTYFEQEYAQPAGYTTYEYIPNKEEAFKAAMNSDKENVLILGSYYTRYFRSLVEELEEQENSENEEIVE